MTNQQALRRDRKAPVAMLVDDDFFMRELFQHYLPADGVYIPIAKGSDALDAYKTHMPDIIFIDRHLPELSTPDLLKDLIAFDAHVYAVIISGDNSRQNIQESVIAGAMAFMGKPLDSRRVLEEYAKATAHHKAR